MAVKLRLMRMGKKKQPTYRMVAADSRSPRDGRFIEVVGLYAPRGRSAADPAAIVEIDDAKVIRWLSNGAKPTDRVERLLQQSGTMERFRTGAPAMPIAEPGADVVSGLGSGIEVATVEAAAVPEPLTVPGEGSVIDEPAPAEAPAADVAPAAAEDPQP